MACVNEAAVRAKAMAEKKFLANNMIEAKHLALATQRLCPTLEGINQLISTIDVHVASQRKINGLTDWYAVLCLDPSADEEAIKKQYKKLALQLHPDKNTSVGSESAFKIISEAFSVLSDKFKRFMYDAKRISNTRSGYRVPSAYPKTSSQTSGTFWSVCYGCKMQYEYEREYMNRVLVCPTCQKPFMPSEEGDLNSQPKKQNNSDFDNKFNKAYSSSKTSGSYGEESKRKWEQAQASSTEQSMSNHGVTNAADQMLEKMKAEAIKKEVLLKKSESVKRKIGNSSNKNPPGTSSNAASKRARGNVGVNVASFVNSYSGVSGDSNKFRMPGPREFSQKIRGLLIEKAKSSISKKLEDWKAASAAKFASKEKEKEEVKCTENQIRKEVKMDVDHRNSNHKYRDECVTVTDKMHTSAKMEQTTKDDSDLDNEAKEFEVPDPDFHNFDGDRTERSIKGDEIWATYDEEDGMPRYYAFVQKVASLKPFKVRMSYLSAKSNSEFGSLDWVRSGFAKTCGEFRVGKYITNDAINIFSHKVEYEKGARGVIKIFPRKGNVWALYRNWSRDWDEHTPDDVMYKYDMVEVLEDYSEDKGVLIAPLVKVLGFRTVFRRHPDNNKFMNIPREEMFRFSHQVPNYLLTGEEGKNAPKGCLELDPASVPIELLQILTEANEVKR